MKKVLLALVVITVAISIALGMALATDSGERTLLGMPLMLGLAAVAFLIQWLAFIPAFWAQTEKYFDLVGSLTYLSLIALVLLLPMAEPTGARTLLLATLTGLWAIRLGSFLFVRVQRRGKDGRFDEIKTQGPRFLASWTLQGLWVFLTLLPALTAMTSSRAPQLDLWAMVGGLIWLSGWLIEVVADRQKSAFNESPDNAGKFITTGLWAWSRHPNYFGEILLWFGVFIIAVPSLAGLQWLALISPIFVMLLITRVSGVPLLEQRADARWGNDPAYQTYRDSTPVLIPRPPKAEQNV